MIPDLMHKYHPYAFVFTHKQNQTDQKHTSQLRVIRNEIFSTKYIFES